jgi:hypothetical protein
VVCGRDLPVPREIRRRLAERPEMIRVLQRSGLRSW